ncbi:MAG TPA: glycoside hydrolase N-terminal domain-containing protein, partial [Paludibacter sp.]|nr:glycoside hydrolase N-terminal domain-containing protein [Paludibacter sp.]
ISYLREYFASNPDSAIVMRISTPGNTGKLTFTVNLSNAHTGTPVYSGNNITMSGKLTTVNYEAQVAVLNEGGSLSTTSSEISVTNADAVTIVLSGATNYNPALVSYVSGSAADLHSLIASRVQSASAKTYDVLKTAHLNDYQPLFSRVKLDLEVNEPDINTDDLIRSHKDNSYLDILYYQYGRYLMLGSSRGMALPSNLQGLWNNVNNPAWQCDIHSNINVQMNYWPAENANLSECHIPFLKYVNFEAGKVNGSWSKMAATPISNTSNGEFMAGNYKGWTLRTQNNIFGYSDWNWNRPANAWYCMHMWQHYRYTNDTTYLRDIAFPTMKSACEFWFSRLKAYPNGQLYAPDEWSPEHGSWEDNIAYAQQLIWELFDGTLKAARILNADATFTNTLAAKFAKLENGVKIGSWGQIKEWTTQADVQNDDHRHLSHMIALYPGNQISYRVDSAFANAAKVSMNSRGDNGTGWSRAWKISCWARLQDGDHAYKLMKAAQNMTTYTSVSMSNDLGGVYENLLDAHPSYQIDGNFGFTAGVTEMLLQTNQGYIYPLPALPSVWPNGSFKGLKAVGNFTVDLTWKNARPYNAVIYSGSGDSCRIYYPSIAVSAIICSGAHVDYTIKNNMLVFATEKGLTYSVDFDFGTATTAAINPFYTINSEAKTAGAIVEVLRGATVTLSPESTVDGGSWAWTGPNNFTASTREITLSNAAYTQSGNYIATQTVDGAKVSKTFNLLVKLVARTRMNVIPAGDYYIKKTGTELYWTNNNVSGSGSTPVFMAKGSGSNANAQVWTLSLDGGYYKIVSKADGRYVNEKGNFGTNAYYANWNTYNLYSDSVFTGIQITQNAATQEKGTKFWNLNSSSAIVYSTNTEIDESKDLPFEFVSTTLSAVSNTTASNNKVWVAGNNMNFSMETPADIYIYNQLGRLVKKLNAVGNQSVSMTAGVYFVKAVSNPNPQVYKVIVK